MRSGRCTRLVAVQQHSKPKSNGRAFINTLERASLMPIRKVAKKKKESRARENEKMEAKAECSHSVIVFDTTGLPTNQIKLLREQLKDHGAVIKSKKSAMAKALQSCGYTPPDLTENAHLFFVEGDLDAATAIIESFASAVYIRQGDVAPETVTVSRGVLKADGMLVPTASERRLVEYGMPVVMRDDTLLLEEDFRVCSEGEAVDANAVTILKTLKIPLLTRRARILATLRRQQ